MIHKGTGRLSGTAFSLFGSDTRQCINFIFTGPGTSHSVVNHLRYADTQTIPHNLHTDYQKDKRGQTHQDVCARLAKYLHQTVRVAITDVYRNASEDHRRESCQESARVAVLETRASLVP